MMQAILGHPGTMFWAKAPLPHQTEGGTTKPRLADMSTKQNRELTWQAAEDPMEGIAGRIGVDQKVLIG